MEQNRQTFCKSTYLRRGPQPAAGQVLQAAHAVVLRPAATVAESGLRRKQHSLLKCLSKAKNKVPPMEKPKVVKMHLWDMIILPKNSGRLQGQDPQPGGNQAWDDWPLYGQVLNHLQACEARAAQTSGSPTSPASSPSGSLHGQ